MSLDRSRWNVQYMQRVLATDPIAYWIQDEKQGAVSYDMVSARSNGARNGAYTGVTLGQPGIGDGRTSPFFDGVNDFNRVSALNFRTAFNGDEGSVLGFARVANAGVWTDGVVRMVLSFRVDGANRVFMRKEVANNTVRLTYTSGGVDLPRIVAGLTSVDWLSYGITWSAAADEVRAYINGVQQGATQNGLGVWVGLLTADGTNIGARLIAPTNVWDGYIAHVSVWDYALSPATMLSLGVLR